MKDKTIFGYDTTIETKNISIRDQAYDDSYVYGKQKALEKKSAKKSINQSMKVHKKEPIQYCWSAWLILHS